MTSDFLPTTLAAAALAFGAGALGGTMNALAGGGTFATLPALIALGLPANVANASSNVALLPGAAASAWAYRDELGPIGGVSVRTLAAISFAGGVAGALLLVLTPPQLFDLVIPWLLLFATLVLAWGPRAAAWLRQRTTIGASTLKAVQFLLGIYGGYFGGGLGLIAAALFGLLAGIDPRGMFAPRTMMLALTNTAAAIVFVASGLVRWAACLPMMAGAILGGWLGARFARRLPAAPVRVWTLLVTAVTTFVFFRRAYG